MHSLRSSNIWNEAPNIHDDFNNYGCQTIVVEDARMANSILMLFVQHTDCPTDDNIVCLRAIYIIVGKVSIYLVT